MATDTLLAERPPSRTAPDNLAVLAPLIELRHVSKSYVGADGGSPVTILDDVSLEIREGEMLALLGHAYGVSGKRAEALQVISELQELQGRQYVSPYTVAAIYAGLGEKDQAFKWLEKANDERDIWLMNLKVDPVFSKLRADRRFADLLARAGLRP